MQKGLLVALFLFSAVNSLAQPLFTANDTVTPYSGLFYYGSNMGWYPPWQDTTLADIAAGNPLKGVDGVGIKSFRPAIPAWYMEQRGYKSLLAPFQHYQRLGVRENTVFIGDPDPKDIDTTFYTDQWDRPSAFFKNLYEPIWDGGANGTPVNENNPYAFYVYQTVKLYHPYVKYWEIWNEPDFEAGQVGNLARGEVGNWWENDPAPHQLPRTRAPLYHYIRILRISYEVIKSIDPSAYVAIGGIGYESYLDAVLRNTDNPDQGKFTEDYPMGGGAYFDVLSFHLYPQFEPAVREKKRSFWFWQEIDYNRHSDAATQSIVDKKKRFIKVLDKYGYDSRQYPRKELIITEINVPRIAYGEELGGKELQRNFIPKALITCQKHDIRQMYIFGIGDGHEGNGEQDGYASMGLYQELAGVPPYQQRIHDAGIAFRTTSTLLLGSRYDALKTLQMQLPDNIEGGAFLHSDGSYTYALWAKTHIDRSEKAHAQYCFPLEWALSELDIYDWESNSLKYKFSPNGSCISLNSSPIFIKPHIPTHSFKYHIQLQTNKLHIYLLDKDVLSINIYSQDGDIIKRLSQIEFTSGGLKKIHLNQNLDVNIYFVEVIGKRGRSRVKVFIKNK